jgi:hypothetical protein
LNFVREQSEREVKMGDLNERDEISEWKGEEVSKLGDRGTSDLICGMNRKKTW